MRQFNANLVGHLRGSFTEGEGLIAVVGNGSVLLAEAFFDRYHFFPRCAGIAVDPGHKALKGIQFLINLLCLVAADSVRDNILQPLTLPLRHIPVFIEFWVSSLFWVLNIDHHLAQPAIDPPDGCDCHSLPFDGAGRYNSFRDLLDRCLKLRNGSIVPLDINDIQSVGFLSNLVQIVANAVKLLHHGVVIRGRSILWNDPNNKVAKVHFLGQSGTLHSLQKGLVFLVIQPYLNTVISLSDFIFAHRKVLSFTKGYRDYPCQADFG